MTDQPGAPAALAKLDELPPGSVVRCEVAERAYCVVRTEAGSVFAVDDLCSHEDESLSNGWLDGDTIECPAHNSIFDLASGEPLSLPAEEPIGTYETSIDDGVVYLRSQA
jgi:3-phenylpropionate/trans-cinnamate dioxygenase ferredoxin subunit